MYGVQCDVTLSRAESATVPFQGIVGPLPALHCLLDLWIFASASSSRISRAVKIVEGQRVEMPYPSLGNSGSCNSASDFFSPFLCREDPPLWSTEGQELIDIYGLIECLWLAISYYLTPFDCPWEKPCFLYFRLKLLSTIYQLLPRGGH